jgi:hypothetical protein
VIYGNIDIINRNFAKPNPSCKNDIASRNKIRSARLKSFLGDVLLCTL